jgi:hypothetical protein
MSNPNEDCSKTSAITALQSISVLLPERFGFRLAPSAHNSMCSPESPQLCGLIHGWIPETVSPSVGIATFPQSFNGIMKF